MSVAVVSYSLAHLVGGEDKRDESLVVTVRGWFSLFFCGG